jgi:hypothetical protein
MSMKRIRLELARDHEFPEVVGNVAMTSRERCRVKRFWHGEKDEFGHLVHLRGGSWAFDCEAKPTDDDEPGFKFDRHRLIPGEYVSITEHDSVMYRSASSGRIIWMRDL